MKKISSAVLLTLLLCFAASSAAPAADLSVIPAAGWSYAGNTLTITVNGTYTISGASSTDVIVVSSGLTNVNVTLNGVNIDVSGINNACAFNMTGATVNLTLVGDNTLKSGASRAGLEVPEGSTLTIAGDGSLTATGGARGYNSLGVGGTGIGFNDGSSNKITINGGIVTAIGPYGVGIGGGGAITINDGVVTADNYFDYGIGIGGGGTIIINGGVVTARPGASRLMGFDAGFGIGGGGGEITINGGIITARGGVEGGAGIGFRNGSGNTITITGGDITASSIGSYGNYVSITGQPVKDTTVTADDIAGNLSVTADVRPSGTLSYQWYFNAADNNSGGAPISGATNDNFVIPINLSKGTYYYYCVVSNFTNQTVHLHSNVARVTVTSGQSGGNSDENGGDPDESGGNSDESGGNSDENGGDPDENGGNSGQSDNSNMPPPLYRSKGNGGCNAGYGFIVLAVLVPFTLKKQWVRKNRVRNH